MDSNCQRFWREIFFAELKIPLYDLFLIQNLDKPDLNNLFVKDFSGHFQYHQAILKISQHKAVGSRFIAFAYYLNNVQLTMISEGF